MSIKLPYSKTRTVCNYSHLAADGFFNALSFNALAKASAKFADASMNEENRPQSLQELSLVQGPLRKVCGDLIRS